MLKYKVANLGIVNSAVPDPLLVIVLIPRAGDCSCCGQKSGHYNANSSDTKMAVAGDDKGACSYFHAIVNVFLAEWYPCLHCIKYQ